MFHFAGSSHRIGAGSPGHHRLDTISAADDGWLHGKSKGYLDWLRPRWHQDADRRPLLNEVYGYEGIFWATLISNVLLGIAGWAWFKMRLVRMSQKV